MFSKINFFLLCLSFCLFHFIPDLEAGRQKKKSFNPSGCNLSFDFQTQNPYSVLSGLENVFKYSEEKTVSFVNNEAFSSNENPELHAELIQESDEDFFLSREDTAEKFYLASSVKNREDETNDIIADIEDLYSLQGLQSGFQKFNLLKLKGADFQKRNELKQYLQHVADFRQNLYNRFFEFYVQQKIQRIKYQNKEGRFYQIYERYRQSNNSFLSKKRKSFKTFLIQMNVKSAKVDRLFRRGQERLELLWQKIEPQFKDGLRKHLFVAPDIYKAEIQKIRQKISSRRPIRFNQFLCILDEIDQILSETSHALGGLLAHHNFIEREDQDTDSQTSFFDSDEASEEDNELLRSIYDLDYSLSEDESE